MNKKIAMMACASLLILLILQGCLRNEIVMTPSQDETRSRAIVKAVIDEPNEPQDVVPQEPEKKATHLIAVGDIMLSRHVGTKIVESGRNDLPFTELNELLASADITFGNLESPFSDTGPRVTEGMVFKAEPEFIEGVISAGFDVLSIANNHSMNQGVYGVTYTIEWLSDHGMFPVGGGVDFSDAHAGEMFQDGGTGDLVGFLAYSYTGYNDIFGAANPVIAEMNIEQLTRDVTDMKTRADIVVVSMHAGVEYVTQPNDQQMEFAHAAIDAGADLVIGHHPHWPQIYEPYQDGFIFYSLGNFVFEHWEVSRLELMPVLIENSSTPRLANEDEKTRILSHIGISAKQAVVRQ